MAKFYLERVWWSLFLCLAAVPLLWALGPVVENRYFPVVTNVTVYGEVGASEGLLFEVAFRKARPCEFLGVSWYLGSKRVGVEFEPNSEKFFRSRPTGEQTAGPWLAKGITTLRGTHAIAHHRCHPLWVTETLFYDGRPK